MSVRPGDEFMLHLRSGEVRGPFVVEDITGRGGGFTPYCRLQRQGAEKVAWASEKWLREGLRDGVGWMPA